jgi:hypothetical protein
MAKEEKEKLKIYIGSFVTIISTIITIWFWGKGDNITVGGPYFKIPALLMWVAPIYVLDGMKVKMKELGLIGAGYMILIALLLNLYTYLFLKPQIIKNGKITNGIVYDSYYDDDEPIIMYEYEVNGVKYLKEDDDLGNKPVGTKIKIAFLEWEPHYHLVVKTKKKSR